MELKSVALFSLSLAVAIFSMPVDDSMGVPCIIPSDSFDLNKTIHEGASDACHGNCGGGAGRCLSCGRCLCWYGWSGPNGEYITEGDFIDHILADDCSMECPNTPDYHPLNCTLYKEVKD